MHFNNGEIPLEYSTHIRRKYGFLVLGVVGIVIIFLYSIGKGPVNISIVDVVKTLSGETVSKQFDLIIWNIRLSQAIAAIVAGCGLSLCGAVMQAVLRNPLGSPFTLGISHAAAFGAAFSVMFLDIGTMSSLSIGDVTIDNSYLTTIIAFSFSMLATGVIIGISRLRKATPFLPPAQCFSSILPMICSWHQWFSGRLGMWVEHHGRMCSLSVLQPCSHTSGLQQTDGILMPLRREMRLPRGWG